VSTPNKTILLVEDNASDEALVLLALGMSQVDSAVVVARDGVEALDYVFGQGIYEGRDTSVMPTVVFLDLKLPKIDGLQVLRQLRADGRSKSLPVVVFTSSDQEQDVAASYNLGANSFVSKPVDFDKFAEAVRQMGQYWTRLNECP